MEMPHKQYCKITAALELRNDRMWFSFDLTCARATNWKLSLQNANSSVVNTW